MQGSFLATNTQTLPFRLHSIQTESRLIRGVAFDNNERIASKT